MAGQAKYLHYINAVYRVVLFERNSPPDCLRS
jgi:hypothetical protein